jgi:hypothetical protein
MKVNPVEESSAAGRTPLVSLPGKKAQRGALLLQFETEKSCAGARRFRFGKGRLFFIDEKRSKLG